MFELAMASASCNQHPAVIRELPEDLANLHRGNYARRDAREPNCGLTLELSRAAKRRRLE